MRVHVTLHSNALLEWIYATGIAHRPESHPRLTTEWEIAAMNPWARHLELVLRPDYLLATPADAIRYALDHLERIPEFDLLEDADITVEAKRL